MTGLGAEDADVVLPAGYQPDWMEVSGRKLKMEYLGMGSVFTLIGLIAFGHLTHVSQTAIATGGTLLLFMGLKKKTRDHIAASFLLFTAAALAGPGVRNGAWALPYALFGACVWAMEGYLEKRRTRIYALPIILGGFAAISPFWPLALVFVGAYLLEPRPEVPGIRRRLAWIVALSAGVSAITAAVVASRSAAVPFALDPLTRGLLILYASVAVISVLCLAVYWTRLAVPHRLNAILLGVLAPFDTRVVAMFGMASMVLLSATVFRHGIDSDRLRPLVKHAEWYFFPLVLAAASWAALVP